MKPQTKIQHAVVRLSKKLPVLSEDEKNYAINNLFPKLAYATKSSGFCLECGKSIDIKKIVRKKVVCEHCGKTLKVELTRKRSLDMSHYTFSTSHLVIDGIYDFQVIRTYEFFSYHKKGQAKKTWCREVCQNWYDKSGKEVIIACLISYGGNFQGDLTLRSNRNYGWYYKNYHISAELHTYLPELRPEYLKKGINSETLSGVSLKTLIKELEYSSIETIVKSKYLNIYKSWRTDDVLRYFPTLKICLRNKYKINDPTMYLDLLNALERLKLDLHNPYYICPKNLKKSHDYYIKMVRDRKEQERLIRQAERIEEEQRKKSFTQKQYKEEKGKFFDLCFKENNIEITPLKSIKEFKIEGKELSHCVGSYYTKKDSLILSAKVDNVRTETIEISLENFKIIQCKGYDNEPSKHHDDIMRLMQSKISHIRRKATKRFKLKQQLQSA